MLSLLCLLCVVGTADITEISASTTLDPSKTYGPIVIKKSGITIDGRGATILGQTEGNPKTFKGDGISADGVNDVTIKNVKVKGFETGLHLKNAKKWIIEGCDFSDNFHDPEFGWGEQGRRGGIVLENADSCRLRKNKANRVWDACVLLDSNDNTITENNFSHTSNTCLKMWHSSFNTIEKNNLSYGLRIKEGEVHARDSTGVLIESGSNVNKFRDNDVTHGGDGIFIRVLNGWVSVANQFERNDCSYANNNGFEAWSPNNTYLHNKANYCSYGFWLGASDNTVLEGNEASFNGDPKGFHNSPHLPKNGHAGIVFMFGTSDHTRAVGNICKNNNGAGIALIGEPGKFKAYHWVLEDNILENNRWGIYARHADWIDMAGNDYQRNREADFSKDETVTHVNERDAISQELDRWSTTLKAPKVVEAGKGADFEIEMSAPKAKDADGEELDVKALREAQYVWDFGDGPKLGNVKMAHTFTSPGLHQGGVTTSMYGRSRLSGFVVYVLDGLPEISAESKDWSWSDAGSKVAFEADSANKLVGSQSIKALINPYSGGRVNLVNSPREGVKLEGKSTLIFWVKYQNGNIPGWQGPNPIVTLKGNGDAVTFTPKIDRLAQPVNNEARRGWTRFEVPLAGGDGWEKTGALPKIAESISLGFDSWGADPLVLWIDGISVK